MKVRVVNSPDKEFTPYVRKATFFYGNYLIPNKRLRENISLKIKFNKNINYWGLAYIDDYNDQGKARKFVIEIHPWIGAREIFKTLAHEMVHVRQYAKGHTNESLSKWKGTPINPDTIDYYHHPWEMEAYSMETCLYTKFATKEQLWYVFKGIENPDSPIKKEKINWRSKPT